MTDRTDQDRTAIGGDAERAHPFRTDGALDAPPQARNQSDDSKGYLGLSSDPLLELLKRTDGYLRMIPDGEHKSVFLKWKYSRGRHQGTYVMAVVPDYQVHFGLQLLEKKVWEVNAGVRRPTPDTLAYER